MENLSYSEINSMSEEELLEINPEILLSSQSELTDMYNELHEEYMNGDRDMYPPDWWDQYVFPIDCAIRKLDECLKEECSEEDNSEEDSW